MFIIYQQDLLELGAEDALERARDGGLDRYSQEVVLGVAENTTRIDALLARHLHGWELGRLGALERAILRVAAYELLCRNDVPEPVAIDQAVECAKRFCSDEAGALVNGVLGALAASHREGASAPAGNTAEIP